ncbi:MAG TPA: hypothetical protein DIW52_24145, partial [Pseudomonas sp.]|nr:hypothetical protein [Pseudomonas sp.]
MHRVRSAPQVAGSLAAALFIAPMGVQAKETGFIEDSSLTLNTRQWYSHEIGRKDTYFSAQTSEGRRGGG